MCQQTGDTAVIPRQSAADCESGSMPHAAAMGAVFSCTRSSGHRQPRAIAMGKRQHKQPPLSAPHSVSEMVLLHGHNKGIIKQGVPWIGACSAVETDIVLTTPYMQAFSYLYSYPRFRTFDIKLRVRPGRACDETIAEACIIEHPTAPAAVVIAASPAPIHFLRVICIRSRLSCRTVMYMKIFVSEFQGHCLQEVLN